MIEREIVIVPFERICLDLVSPLPKSKGGFQYTHLHGHRKQVARCKECHGQISYECHYISLIKERVS